MIRMNDKRNRLQKDIETVMVFPVRTKRFGVNLLTAVRLTLLEIVKSHVAFVEFIDLTINSQTSP